MDSVHEIGIIRLINQQESVGWGFATHTKNLFLSMGEHHPNNRWESKLYQQYLKPPASKWLTLMSFTVCPIQSFSASLPNSEGFLQSIHFNICQTFRISPQEQNELSLNNEMMCSFPASKGVRLRFWRFGEVTKMLPYCSSWSSLTWWEKSKPTVDGPKITS